MTAKLVRDGLNRLPVADDRNRFFTGKFLSARDLSDEQAYFLGRHRLHNLIHGWGVVVGFEAEIDPSNDRCVVVHPGFALDPLGRELILREAASFILPADRTSNIIVVRHVEDFAEPVPVLVPDKEDGGSSTDHNRVVETVEIEAVDPIEISAEQWSGRDVGHGSARSRDAVPIAHIADGIVDLNGRRRLGDCQLTRIVGVNWCHNGKTKVAAIDEDGLQITFSGPIDPATISVDILEVRLQDEDGSNPMSYPAGTAACLQGSDEEVDGTRVRFDLPSSAQTAVQTGRKVFVQLHCDFLLDGTGTAVDGNFLGGHLPTGNGRPGGSFISWFELD